MHIFLPPPLASSLLFLLSLLLLFCILLLLLPLLLFLPFYLLLLLLLLLLIWGKYVISLKSLWSILLILLGLLLYFSSRSTISVKIQKKILLPKALSPSKFRHNILGLRKIANSTQSSSKGLSTWQLIGFSKIDRIASNNKRQFPKKYQIKYL